MLRSENMDMEWKYSSQAHTEQIKNKKAFQSKTNRPLADRGRAT